MLYTGAGTYMLGFTEAITSLTENFTVSPSDEKYFNDYWFLTLYGTAVLLGKFMLSNVLSYYTPY